MKNQIINKHGVIVEVGKTYYYYNIGLGEIKTHTVKYFSNNFWAVDYNGRVEIDSLFYSESQVIK